MLPPLTSLRPLTLSHRLTRSTLSGLSRAHAKAPLREAFRPHLYRPFSTSRLCRQPSYVRFEGEPNKPPQRRRWDLTTQIFAAVVVGGGVYYVTHLEKVPETGRWRFMDVNPKYETKLAKAAHDELSAEFKGKFLPENHPVTRHVRRVVTRILEASNLGTLASPEPTYLATAGPVDDLWASNPQSPDDVPPGAGGMQWNLMVVNDDRVVNAAASYGNIIVFTGILPIAKDEQGLAAVLGHEIGHVVLRHNSERYSNMKVLIGLAWLLEIAGIDFGFARILTSLLYDLPNSRTQELEADQIGLKLAAKACFDPSAAPEMFVRLGELEKRKGGLNIGFISTHPPSAKRVQQLEQLLPDAYAIQAASPDCSQLQDSINAFRNTFAHSPWQAAAVDDGATWRRA